MTRPVVRPGKQIVLEVPGEGLFRIYTGGKGKPSVYRVAGKGSIERRVRDEETLRKVAQSFRGYVDERKKRESRWTFRLTRWIRTLPGRVLP